MVESPWITGFTSTELSLNKYSVFLLTRQESETNLKIKSSLSLMQTDLINIWGPYPPFFIPHDDTLSWQADWKT